MNLFLKNGSIILKCWDRISGWKLGECVCPGFCFVLFGKRGVHMSTQLRQDIGTDDNTPLSLTSVVDKNIYLSNALKRINYA